MPSAAHASPSTSGRTISASRSNGISREHFEKLEISILPHWDNAQYGYGFLEIGSQFEKDGSVLPFTLDFDVIAHEVGHAFIYSMLGVPELNAEFPEYEGFQESFSDCVSLIAAMHFPSVIDQVLDETRGNLYLSNRIARFSEFPGQRQIRTPTTPARWTSSSTAIRTSTTSRNP